MIEYENLQKVNKSLFTKYQNNFEIFLKSGRYILSDNVISFEKQFANYCDSPNCIGVASGLDAIILAIDAFNFPRGSEIIVPSNTYIATIMAIVRNGFTPILVEPEIETYNIDPTKVEEKISDKTVAILPVHLYGKPCKMDELSLITKKYNLELIEDCAQAHGAKYKNQFVGTFGVGCFSFYPTKNLGALGDGGAILCYEKWYMQKIKSLRNYGRDNKNHNKYLGYNSRLDEIQAGFLSTKLTILDEITKHKRELASLYLDNLNDRFIKPVVSADSYDVYHIFNIRHKDRDELKKHLLKKEIKTEVHYSLPPHKQKSMRGIIKGEYPISEEIHNTTLSLPISYFHTKEDVLTVCKAINNWNE
jgi:dTDP-4-amino-4,6-dideoxygalactose transaminase